MSIADHFDHSPDAGFIRYYNAQAARRQFQVSVILVFVLAMAAFALGLLVRFDAPVTAPPSIPSKASGVSLAAHLPGVRS
ncbi:MAG TPA: hypothetical protein VEQ35_09650 [Beijerinckia sp.]|jgi:hypothetical protein|nr:hypothetical protein [Beijerinckia sp.]